MPKELILVVEDEEDIVEVVEYNLAREGYRVRCVDTGEEGLKLARSLGPDLVVLDLMLPGIDGMEVCRALKSDPETSRIPVVMLTAKSQESDIVAGLELGADDYIAKPFSPRVLVARVRAALRRRREPAPADQEPPLEVRELVIDPGRHQVTAGGEPVKLTLTEFRILNLLARKPGRVFSRYQIVDAVRGEDYPVTERSVDVQIVGLRKKLGRCGKYIETVRGVGYRFKE